MQPVSRYTTTFCSVNRTLCRWQSWFSEITHASLVFTIWVQRTINRSMINSFNPVIRLLNNFQLAQTHLVFASWYIIGLYHYLAHCHPCASMCKSDCLLSLFPLTLAPISALLTCFLSGWLHHSTAKCPRQHVISNFKPSARFTSVRCLWLPCTTLLLSRCSFIVKKLSTCTCTVWAYFYYTLNMEI